MPVLKVANLKKSYQNRGINKTVIDSISFELPEAQCVITKGRNGSGKSTIADLLASMLKPDAGRIYCLGMDIHQNNRIKSQIGYMGQSKYMAIERITY